MSAGMYRRTRQVLEIGPLVRERRLLLRMTQGYLAKRIGASHTAVQKIELGDNGPNGATLVLLMRELGITLEEVTACLREVPQ